MVKSKALRISTRARCIDQFSQCSCYYIEASTRRGRAIEQLEVLCETICLSGQLARVTGVEDIAVLSLDEDGMQDLPSATSSNQEDQTEQDIR